MKGPQNWVTNGVQSYGLTWFDPRDKSQLYAGLAYLNQGCGQYELYVEEDHHHFPLFLSLSHQHKNGKAFYKVERKGKNRVGFASRKIVGHGVFDPTLDRYIQINYGSKFKTLLLDLGEQRRFSSLAQACNA